MNLDEALRLRDRIERETKAAEILYNETRDGFFGSDLPRSDKVWVVTRDGASFSAMTFSGEYSDYREAVWDYR